MALWLLVIRYVQRVRPSYMWSGPLLISLKESSLKMVSCVPARWYLGILLSLPPETVSGITEDVPFFSIPRMAGHFSHHLLDMGSCRKGNEGKIVIQQALLQLLLYLWLTGFYREWIILFLNNVAIGFRQQIVYRSMYSINRWFIVSRLVSGTSPAPLVSLFFPAFCWWALR